ncbi:MAG: hypothetical protein ACOXZU_10940 [Bacteroidales bacterium]|nr:hypothetical protein [Bacteroidales bacterium]
MNKKIKKLRKPVVFLTLTLVIIAGMLLFGNFSTNRLVTYLSPSHRVDANTVILEGWLPSYTIDSAKKEFERESYNLIILTGLKHYGLDYCTVGMNGFLIFYPGQIFKDETLKEEHLIEIDAFSEMDGIYQSHINFYVNDSLISDFNISMKKQKYPVKWYGSLGSIDSLMIEFTNDMLDDYGDRNLYVKELIFNEIIKIHYRNNSVYDIGALDNKNRMPSDYDSSPAIKKRKLISSGVDSSKIIVITAENTRMNRTLASALAVKRWIDTSEYQIRGLNIMSLGVHSRRTWITYKRVLNKSYDIGIIPITEINQPDFYRNSNLSLWKETLSLFYYWIILIPFFII